MMASAWLYGGPLSKVMRTILLTFGLECLCMEQVKPLTVVLVGKTGAGKSETAATLYGPGGDDIYISHAGIVSNTQPPRTDIIILREYPKVTAMVQDTRGFFDTVLTMEEQHQMLTRSMSSSEVDVFLWCVESRFSDQEKENLDEFVLMAGEEVKDHLIIVFTKVGNTTEDDLMNEIGSSEGRSMEYLRGLLGGLWVLGKRLPSPGRAVPMAVMGNLAEERREHDRKLLGEDIISLASSKAEAFPTLRFQNFMAWKKVQIGAISIISSDVRRNDLSMSLQSVQRGQRKQEEFVEILEKSQQADAIEKQQQKQRSRGVLAAVFLGGILVPKFLESWIFPSTIMNRIPMSISSLVGALLSVSVELGYLHTGSAGIGVGPFGAFSAFILPTQAYDFIDSWGLPIGILFAAGVIGNAYQSYTKWRQMLENTLTEKEQDQCESAYTTWSKGKDLQVLDKFGNKKRRLMLWTKVKQHMKEQDKGNAWNAFQKFLGGEGINLTSSNASELYGHMKPIFVDNNYMKYLEDARTKAITIQDDSFGDEPADALDSQSKAEDEKPSDVGGGAKEGGEEAE